MIDPMHNPDHFQNPKRQSFTEALLKRDGLQGPVLDIGENVWTHRLAKELGASISSTSHDLDWGGITGRWGSILCFEVLEHLGNPLLLLKEMADSLADDGSIWLSTPIISPWRPPAFRAGNHVVEFDYAQLEFLFHKAGLQAVEEYRILYKPWWKYLRGPRPFLRLLTDRCYIVRLQKKE